MAVERQYHLSTERVRQRRDKERWCTANLDKLGPTGCACLANLHVPCNSGRLAIDDMATCIVEIKTNSRFAYIDTGNYPFYAHSAIDRNLWHVPAGVAWSYTPYFSDWFFSGDAAYVFTEKTLGHDVSHWLFNLRAGYYLTPRFVPMIFVSKKYGTKGLGFPDDFDPSNLDTEEFYYHDRTIKHNWINAGIGFDWVLNEKYLVSGSWFKMIVPEQVNVVDRAWTFGVTVFFGGAAD